MRPVLSVTAAGLVCALAFSSQPSISENPDADEQFLAKHAKLATGDAALLELLRSRSSADADLKNLDQLTRQLGDKEFPRREEATRKLVALEWTPLPALRRTLSDPDSEIASRAQICINRIEQRTSVYWIPAAVRLVVKRKPAGAPQVLLAFLPYTADPDVEEEIYYGLDDLAEKNGQLHAVLISALNDQLPARRAVGACIVGRRGNAQQQAAVRKLMEKDSDPWVRLRAAQGLLAAKHKSAVPALIELLDQPFVALTWQAEELLHWTAGDEAPTEKVGTANKTQRETCQVAWQKWWANHGAGLDLARHHDHPRRPGLVFVNDTLKEQQRLVLAGCDGVPRTVFPLDDRHDGLAWLPEGGFVAVGATHNGWPVAAQESDLNSKLLWSTDIRLRQNGNSRGLPQAWRRLPAGRIFLAFEDHVAEFDFAGKPVRDFAFDKVNGPIRTKADIGVLAAGDWHPWYSFSTTFRSKTKPIVSLRTGGELRVLPGDAYQYVHGADGLIEKSGGLPGRAAELDREQRVVWDYASPGWAHIVRCVYPLVRFGFDRPLTQAMSLDASKHRVPQLKSPHPFVRQHALRVLCGLDDVDQDALKLAFELLGHEQPLMRRYGVQIVGNACVRARAFIPELVELLGDEAGNFNGDTSIYAESRRALGRIGPDAIPALLAVLADHDRPKAELRRNNAIRVLVHSYLGVDPRVAAAVRSAFQDTQDDVREIIIFYLGLRQESALQFVPELGKALEDSQDRVVWRSLYVLSALGPKARASLPSIKKAIKHPTNGGLALQTFAAVGRHDAETLPFLISYLKPRDGVDFVGTAAQALAKDYGKAAEPAVPQLIAAFKERQTDKEQRVLSDLARTLGEIGVAAKDAVPLLMPFVEAPRDRLSDGGIFLRAIEKIDPVAGKQAGERYGKHVAKYIGMPPTNLSPPPK